MKKVCNSCKRELDEYGRLFPNKSPGGYLIPHLYTESIIKVNDQFLFKKINDKYSLFGNELKYNLSAINNLIDYMKVNLNCDIDEKKISLFNTYGQPNRGYKYHTVSIIYIIKLDEYQLNNNDQCFLSIDEIKASKNNFLLDHFTIISDYIGLF